MMRFNAAEASQAGLLNQSEVTAQLLEDKKKREERALKFGLPNIEAIEDQRKQRSERFKTEN